MDRERMRTWMAYVRTEVIGLPRRKQGPVWEFILHAALILFICSSVALILKLVMS